MGRSGTSAYAVYALKAPKPDTSRMSADELRALLQSQWEGIGHLQARLEGLAIVERNIVPDPKVAALKQFLGCERVACWMRQSGNSEALRHYLRSSDSAPVRLSNVMGNAMECPRGDLWHTHFFFVCTVHPCTLPLGC